eukprot:362822-Chlamydomonas_euryale.AAC.4
MCAVHADKVKVWKCGGGSVRVPSAGELVGRPAPAPDPCRPVWLCTSNGSLGRQEGGGPGEEHQLTNPVDSRTRYTSGAAAH